METKKETYQRYLRLILLVFLAFLFILIFIPFTTPILLAAFVAFGCEPIINKVRHKSKGRRFFSIGLILALLVVLIVPLVLFTLRIASAIKSLSANSMQNSQFFQAIFTLWEKIQNYFSGTVNSLGLDSTIIPAKEELFAKVSPIILDRGAQFLTALPDLGLSLFVFCCMVFVFIMSAANLKNYFRQIEVLPTGEIDDITKTIQKSCYIILVSTILIGALQAFIVAVGSTIFGFHEFFLIFAVTFFLSFIPVIGAAPVAILLALISFLLGNAGHGIGLIVIGVVAGSIDNIVKPFILSSGDDDLHPVLSLLGIIGAVIIFGLPGLLLGPLILQVSTTLVPKLSKKIVKADITGNA